MRDVQQDLNLAEEFSRKPGGEENFLFAEELRHAQLAFQHHIEEIRRIAFAKDYLPSREASSHRKTLALRLVELSEKAERRKPLRTTYQRRRAFEAEEEIPFPRAAPSAQPYTRESRRLPRRLRLFQSAARAIAR
jgi:hypothetical protein